MCSRSASTGSDRITVVNRIRHLFRMARSISGLAMFYGLREGVEKRL
jgi:hypothetical protein